MSERTEEMPERTQNLLTIFNRNFNWIMIIGIIFCVFSGFETVFLYVVVGLELFTSIGIGLVIAFVPTAVQLIYYYRKG